MSEMILRIADDSADIFRKVYPGFVQGPHSLVVPDSMTLERLSSGLQRVGYEAWTRFPGLSARVRPYEPRDRSLEAAEAWESQEHAFCIEYRDELWSTPLQSAYEELHEGSSEAFKQYVLASEVLTRKRKIAYSRKARRAIASWSRAFREELRRLSVLRRAFQVEDLPNR